MSGHTRDVYDVSAYQAFYVQHAGAVAEGYAGGIFRSSIGTLKDGTYNFNTDRIIAADGLPGAYHFFYAHRPVNEQMEVWWEQMEPYWPLDLKSWLDLERATNRRANDSPQELEDKVMQADRRFKQLAGQTWDGIYTSASSWKELFEDQLSGAYNWLLGVAHYTTRPEPFMPLPWRLNNKDWWWFQYTEHGRVSWYRNGRYNIDLGRVHSHDLPGDTDPPTNGDPEILPIELRVPMDRVAVTVSEVPMDEVITP